MNSIYSQYNKIFNEVNPVTTTLEDTLFLTVKKAAFIRSLEYNLEINREDHSNLYFIMPFLRGIVEDYITLKYMNEKIEIDDREQIIKYWLTEDITKSIKAQELFFAKERLHQQVLIPEIIPNIYENHTLFEEDFKVLASKYSWPNRKFPNVFERAKSVDLEEFYRYFYYATSRVVHFNPQLLLKLGWGTKEGVSFQETIFEYSAKNLEKYYNFFCKLYGWMIFSNFYKYFRNDFTEYSTVIETSLSSIRSEFEYVRWPELVTFEELNIPLGEGMRKYDMIKFGPETVAANILRGMYDAEK